MKNSIKLLFMLIFISFTFSSCGVMFGGSRYKGKIVAQDHPNAHIFVNGKEMGIGTANGLFPRNKPLNVELKQEGCEPKIQTFKKAFRIGNFVLSFASWGLIGAAVDLGTGASYMPDHENDPDILKVNDKFYIFNVDYSGCPTK